MLVGAKADLNAIAPFGGHAVFPNIYRDMRQPWKYEKALNSAFIFTVSYGSTTTMDTY